MPTFADLRPAGLLRWRYGPSRAGDYLEAWLQHLALCAAAPEGVAPRTRWLSSDGEFAFAPCADAAAAAARAAGAVPARPARAAALLSALGLDVLRARPQQGTGRMAFQPQRSFGEADDPAYQLALRGIDEPLDARVRSRWPRARVRPAAPCLLDDG